MSKISVLLANKWMGNDPSGYWMSEKLDGVRAYWDGTRLLTRNGNVIHAPKWFLSSLPKIALDGELFAGRGAFQTTVSVVRKQQPVDSEWRTVRYEVFDAPEVPGPVEKRWTAMRAAVRGRKTIVALPQIECRDHAHLLQFHRAVRKKGGEGVMLREPGSKYERRRSSVLLKVKAFDDTEARIVGYVPGTGKYKNQLGAYEVVLLRGSKTKFRVGTGISDHERKRPLRIGTVITVQYQGKTNAGVPRFPVLVTVRDYE